MEANNVQRPDRRAANRQQRRDAILTVAYQSFAERGYGGTTMSEIAARLGGSKATLWGYFPSKEALFAAVIDRATHEFREQVTAVLDPDDDDFKSALRQFCKRFLAKVTSPEAMALRRMVIGETDRFPELGKIFFDRAQYRTQLLLADYITRLQRRGHLAEAPALEAARQLIALCMAGGYQLMLTGNVAAMSAARLDHDVNAALKVFHAAYGVRPATI